ncbi:mRNA,: RTFL01-09-C22 [Quillaja saponaria]|uniref:mRNA,: RTFL01-09-C22 n=1 Tax=Quillaja saponaria TaxID=32244 RepID=A0AAD7M5A5_QUISA|nr:mRNA,: RTFL01-09-C22 [Quillaja saponaria]
MENMKINNSEEMIEHVGFPVHSQVRKIKQESEKIIDWSPGQPEMRPVLKEISRHISRSPLGISGRPISVGDS